MKMSSILTFASLILGATLIIPSITLADPSFDNSGDNRDPFSRASSGDTSGVMQLIQKAQLSKGSVPIYDRVQVNSAAADFLNLQREALIQDAKNSTQISTTQQNK